MYNYGPDISSKKGRSRVSGAAVPNGAYRAVSRGG